MGLFKFPQAASSYPILNFLYQESLDCRLDRDPPLPARPGCLESCPVMRLVRPHPTIQVRLGGPFHQATELSKRALLNPVVSCHESLY